MALKIGLVLVGFLLVYGAIDQMRKGKTYGATGKGRVFRESAPLYFSYLFWVRIVLGLILLGAGLFVSR